MGMVSRHRSAVDVQHPKVVVVGAGSLFFGRQAIWQMVHSPHLQHRHAEPGGDRRRSDWTSWAGWPTWWRRTTTSPLRIEAVSDWRDALPGADFVVLSFANDTVKYRGIDCVISEKYGVRMCSGDTIGPGGIFRAMREFPQILAMRA